MVYNLSMLKTLWDLQGGIFVELGILHVSLHYVSLDLPDCETDSWVAGIIFSFMDFFKN